MSDLLPGTLAKLATELQTIGFAVVREEATKWDWHEVTLRNEDREGGCGVKLTRDRGLWGVTVEVVAGDWQNLNDVLLALNGSKYGSRAMSHEERRLTTLEVLSRLPAGGDELEEIRRRLREYREQRRSAR